MDRNIEMQLLAAHNPLNMARMSERAVDTNRQSLIHPNIPRMTLRADNELLPMTSKDTEDIRHTYINKLALYTRDGVELYEK